MKGNLANDITAFIGLVGMVYSFLWIDAKPVVAIVGTVIGLGIFVWGSHEV